MRIFFWIEYENKANKLSAIINIGMEFYPCHRKYFVRKFSTNNGNYMGRGTGDYKGPHIKMGARIASNSTLLPYIVIGEQAVVAAGAVVTHDVPDKKLVMGVPARVIRDVPEDELLT